MWASLSLFCFGFMIGYLIPRIPWMILPRFSSWNSQFPPHPRPIPVDSHLIQRVLHMRRFHQIGYLFAVIPLFFGLASLRYGIMSLGLGMWLASSWTVISFLSASIGGRVISQDLAKELQLVRNQTTSDFRCCDFPLPSWQVMAVRCTSCNVVLLAIARPDLGRPRSDGKILGLIRLLISDGYPISRTVITSQSKISDIPSKASSFSFSVEEE